MISEFYPLHCSEHEEECSITGILPFRNNTQRICRYCFNKKYIDYNNEDAEEKIRNYFTKEMIDDKYRFKSDFCDEVDCKSWEIMKKIKDGK